MKSLICLVGSEEDLEYQDDYVEKELEWRKSQGYKDFDLKEVNRAIKYRY